jgi:hypothetical protein
MQDANGANVHFDGEPVAPMDDEHEFVGPYTISCQSCGQLWGERGDDSRVFRNLPIDEDMLIEWASQWEPPVELSWSDANAFLSDNAERILKLSEADSRDHFFGEVEKLLQEATAHK